MRIRKLRSLATVAVLSLVAGLALGSQARADFTGSLYVGDNYYTYPIPIVLNGSDTTVGGGSINNSSLNGVALPYLYCIDIPDEVNVGQTYSNTYVNTGAPAKAAYDSGNPVALQGFVNVPNAGSIAWLLGEFAPSANTPALEGGLQAAIWTLVYAGFPGFYSYETGVGGNGAMDAAYTADLAAVGYGGTLLTASTTSYLWLSPAGITNGVPNTPVLQALVTAVPEPSTLAIAGLGAMGLVVYGLRRKPRGV